MKPPVIILIRPQMGENIGAVARAMANFGLTELRLVAPRDGWPNPLAEATAAGATDILAATKVYPDMISAMADVTRAYATTARPRELAKRMVTPEVAVSEMISSTRRGEAGRGAGLLGTKLLHSEQASPHPNPSPLAVEGMAIVFGPERTGITNEDLSWCDTIVTIPTSEDYSSLNLAQSVVVMGYEYFRAQSRNPDPSTPLHSAQDDKTAPLEQYDHLFRQLETALDDADFFKVPEKKPGMWLNIKTMLLRGRFSEQEIRTMHGMVRALHEKK